MEQKEQKESDLHKDKSAQQTLLDGTEPTIECEKTEIVRPLSLRYKLTEIPPIPVSLFVSMQVKLTNIIADSFSD